MRHLLFFAVFISIVTLPAVSGPAAIDPNSFRTRASFFVDGNAMSLSTAVATLVPRPGAPAYSWVRIYFYSFPVVADDVAGIMKGSTASMDKKWMSKASNPGDYNTSRTVIQLSLDQNFKVWQVDMSVPGHSCTIAPFEPDVKTFLQGYQFDGKNLKLKSKGSYVCDMRVLGIPNQKFSWDIDLDAAVYVQVK
jgi:hypothetical protein